MATQTTMPEISRTTRPVEILLDNNVTSSRVHTFLTKQKSFGNNFGLNFPIFYQIHHLTKMLLCYCADCLVVILYNIVIIITIIIIIIVIIIIIITLFILG